MEKVTIYFPKAENEKAMEIADAIAAVRHITKCRGDYYTVEGAYAHLWLNLEPLDPRGEE